MFLGTKSGCDLMAILGVCEPEPHSQEAVGMQADIPGAPVVD